MTKKKLLKTGSYILFAFTMTFGPIPLKVLLISLISDTQRTSLKSLPLELDGALSDRFQKQISFAERRGFFSKKSTNLPVCEEFKLEDLCFQKLTFVDLASSERIKKTGSSGNDLKEAQSISKSLSAFEDVISTLCSEAQQIPYRNHKLTMLMSDALGGNAKTLMFVNVSPAESCLDETNHFLTFAARVRCILNNPIKNVSSKETARLMKLVSYWREQAGKHGDDEELEEIQEERQTKES